MRRVYQVAAVVLFAFALFAVYEAHGLNYYTELGPGAGFFPLWIGVALGGLAIAWFGQVSLQPSEPMEQGFVPDRHGVIRIIAILVALLLFGVLVDTVGFQLMMLAFLLFLLVALGRQNPIVTLVIAIAGSFGLYYIFRNYLDVPLPAASIEFLRNLGL
ncbi:MAG: tripartite tricarboxylate transporter TctB family protein [Bacteroidetes bacterium]|nr:tripartite tricarboxylate transporter TctB family protein [Bacteroidota bacterium]